LNKDFRTYETCGDCMYLIYDEEGSCWGYCHGKFKPGRKKTMDDEIDAIRREVFKKLARRIEYAVDHNKEIRNLTDEELEEADNYIADEV
jgi:hypothetical protein